MALTNCRLRSCAQVCLNRPYVWVLPLVLLGLILGLGIWAVNEGADSFVDAERQKAQSNVESAASAMQLSIQDAIMPAIQLADWIRHTRNLTTLMAEFHERVPDWYARATQANSLISMSPAGVMVRIYPPVPNFPPRLDTLKYPGFREQVLESVWRKTITMNPPIRDEKAGLTIMTFQMPVFFSNVTEAELWPLYRPFNCPPGLCYNATTKTGWWGGASMTLDVSVFISSSGPLSRLLNAGYQVQVWRSPDTYLNETEWVTVADQTLPQPSDAISAKLPVASSVWRVDVWRRTWQPSWQKPLIAVVVVVGVGSAILVFMVLVSWEEHRVLLHTVLPKEAIHRMRQNIDFQRADRDKDTLDMMEIETPAHNMLAIIKANLNGELPPIAMLVAVQQALQRSQDVYRPASQDLQSRLRKAGDIDDEVQRALVNQLTGSAAIARNTVCGTVGDDPDTIAGDDFTIPCLDEMLNQELLADNEASGPQPATNTLVHRQSSTGSTPMSLAARASATGMLQASSDRSTSITPCGRQDLRRVLQGLVPAPNNKEPPGAVAGAAGRASGGSAAHSSAVRPSDVVLAPASASLSRRVSQDAPRASNPEPPILDKLEQVLATANTWQFDAFALDEASHGRPLSVLGYWLMHTSGCISYARMDSTVLARFLQRIESQYRSNPYHNARHAADVLQTFHIIIHQGGLMPGYVDPLTLLGCYLAAIIHDYEHLGVSNDYLVNTQDTLAIRYNDKSPMENHHLAAAWQLLHQPEYNCLSGLTKSKWEKLRKLVIELVLATDMRQHFAILGQFTTQHSLQAKSAQQLISGSGTSAGGLSVRPSVEGHTPVNDQDKLLSLQVALKCADLGHLAAPLPVHLKWLAALEQEFFLQGDDERARGLTISPLCDRDREGVTKSQVSFLEFVVLPLFSNFCQRFFQSRPLLKALVANYNHWKGKATTN